MPSTPEHAVPSSPHVPPRTSHEGFTEGAVVFVNALGWKGIWNRPEIKDRPTVALDKMRQAAADLSPAEIAARLIGHDLLRPEHRDLALLEKVAAEISVAVISDTIVVGIRRTFSKPMADYLDSEFEPFKPELATIGAAAAAAQIIAWRMGLDPVPLAMRGCIAWGEFAIEQSFVMGPAVDEAAEAAGLAEAAAVWLTPTALTALHSASPHSPNVLLAEHDVPLKGGRSFRTMAVVPQFAQRESPDEVRAHRARVLGTFVGGSLDVAIKRQNTVALYDAGERQIAATLLDLEIRTAVIRMQNERIIEDVPPAVRGAMRRLGTKE